MSKPKSLLKEEVPKNVLGEIADYLAKTCGIPGCSPQFHLDQAQEIISIIIDFNKKQERK